MYSEKDKNYQQDKSGIGDSDCGSHENASCRYHGVSDNYSRALQRPTVNCVVLRATVNTEFVCIRNSSFKSGSRYHTDREREREREREPDRVMILQQSIVWTRNVTCHVTINGTSHLYLPIGLYDNYIASYLFTLLHYSILKHCQRSDFWKPLIHTSFTLVWIQLERNEFVRDTCIARTGFVSDSWAPCTFVLIL